METEAAAALAAFLDGPLKCSISFFLRERRNGAGEIEVQTAFAQFRYFLLMRTFSFSKLKLHFNLSTEGFIYMGL